MKSIEFKNIALDVFKRNPLAFAFANSGLSMKKSKTEVGTDSPKQLVQRNTSQLSTLGFLHLKSSLTVGLFQSIVRKLRSIINHTYYNSFTIYRHSSKSPPISN